MVPSSTTVTPLAATCRPIRPANAEVPRRLKSPSSPWPTASCSITPGQPGPSTTSISPAGAGPASQLINARPPRPPAPLCPPPPPRKTPHPLPPPTPAVALAPAIAVGAGFLAAAGAGDHRDIDAHERPNVAVDAGVRAHDLDHLPGRAETDRHLLHARVLLARIGVDLFEQLDLGLEA